MRGDKKLIKSTAYSSQRSYPGHVDSATDGGLGAQQDNDISITLHQVY